MFVIELINEHNELSVHSIANSSLLWVCSTG